MNIIAKAAYLTGSVICLIAFAFVLYKGERDRRRQARQKLQYALAKSMRQQRELDRLNDNKGRAVK